MFRIIDVSICNAYQVGDGWRLPKGLPGDEDQDGTNKEDATKALEEVAKDLLEIVCLNTREGVAAIFRESTLCLLGGKAAGRRSVETLLDIMSRETVPLEIAQV